MEGEYVNTLESNQLETTPTNRPTRFILIVVLILLLLCCCCTFAVLVGWAGWTYGDSLIEQFYSVILGKWV